MADTKPKILIVDDERFNINFLMDVLKTDYKCFVAKNDEHSLKRIAAENDLDLILLDIVMPGMDGYEVCELLKRDKTTQNIPIIFLTVKSKPDEIVKGFEVGSVDYVTKPFNIAELLARIKTHVELKQAREEIKTLRGIIPICANCKKVRDDEGYWKQIETYVEKRTEALFSHGICPECCAELYGNETWYKNIKQEE